MDKGLLDVSFLLTERDSESGHGNELWLVRRCRTFWTWLYCISASIFALNLWLVVSKQQGHSLRQFQAYGPANASLGFGAIYAVSRHDSPRRAELERSADLTGLDIRIPNQPVWQDSDVEEVRAYENSTLSRGSALAWLGHLNALKRFLESPFETALIVEDDIDYDTHIRTEQIPHTAFAIRELLGSQNQTEHYYGDPSLWDILWLGHCGDFFGADRATAVSPMKIFTDPSLPHLEDLHPLTRNFLEDLGATKNQQRLVHKSVNPLCTFAYAINRRTANRLVYDFAAREPSRPIDHPCKAFDVRMLEACRDEGFNCVTVTPELFHHTQAPSEITRVETDPSMEDFDDLEIDFVETPNIRCPARSPLWWKHRKRMYDTPTSMANGEAMSEVAQRPGTCLIEALR